MISAGEMLFGSAPEAPAPFRGPGWENQGELLNQYMMGQFMTPEMLQAQNQRVNDLQRQWEQSGGGVEQQQSPFGFGTPFGQPGGIGGMGGYTRDPRTGQIVMGGYQNTLSGGDEQLRQQLEQARKVQGIMEGSKPYWNDNRFTPGMQLSGQIQPTVGTQAGIMGSQNTLSDLQNQLAQVQAQKPSGSGWGALGSSMQRFAQIQNLNNQIQDQQRSIAQQQASLAETTPQFAARNPFQFQGMQFKDPTGGMTAQQMVGDAFTPQYEMAQRMAEREGGLQREQLANDMARRGMLTSGAMTRAVQMQQRDQGDRLANLSSQLAAQQGQQMFGANQYLQGMGWQQQQAQQQANWARQQAQAEEIFRQQGATDQQASQMAQMALQRQNQAFQQQQAGRQQGISEWALQQQMQRQPMEDLFRLYQLSTGGSPGSPGSPGLLSQLIPAGASLGGAAILAPALAAGCLPKGTPIKMEDGGTCPVDQILPGDEVVGGTVVQVSKSLRPVGHRFFRHTFETGEVVMSQGHPYMDELIQSPVESEEDSDFTYDIRTTGGFYMVNGVRLRSTLG